MIRPPLHEQVVVVVGASSGIGRLTALEFARHGATVVLAARNLRGLQSAALEVEAAGGSPEIKVTDVADWEQVKALATFTIERFGRIDTWVNVAGINVYAPIENTTIEELERIIQVNLMGQIYGVKAVLPHMQARNRGAIINVSSALGVRAAPWMTAYSASKHAVTGFTDALRLELAHQGCRISVTTVYPASMNTPFFRHSRSKLGTLPNPVQPVYDPQIVADCIVFAAVHPRRDIFAGDAGKMFYLLQRLNPHLVDWYMLQNDRIFKQQKSGLPDYLPDNVFEAIDEENPSVRGEFDAQVIPFNPYTRLIERYPAREGALVLGLLAALLGIITTRKGFSR